MGQYKPGATYIHESPDGGRTIYAREFGTTERRLVGYSPDMIEQLEKKDREFQWLAILDLAEKTPALQEAVDRVKVIYELSKEQK
jgi:hypothetical protein